MAKIDDQSPLYPVWETLNNIVLSPFIGGYDSLSKIELVIICGLFSLIFLLISRRSIKIAFVAVLSSTAIIVSGIAFVMMTLKLLQTSLGFGPLAGLINPEEAFGMAFGTGIIAVYFFLSLSTDSASLISVLRKLSKAFDEKHNDTDTA